MRLLRFALPCFLLSISLSAKACPKGPNDDHLTFDQVMINFSNDLIAPEDAAQTGSDDASAVSNADLTDAINGAAAALDCANAVLNDTTGQLYPPEYYEQKGAAAQAAYLNLLYGYMGELADALQTYESDFQQLASEPAASRDFTSAETQSASVDEIATDAHRDLQ